MIVNFEGTLYPNWNIMLIVRCIRQCVSRQVMLSMVVSLVLQRLDFGNATLVGLPAYQLSRLQSVLNLSLIHI